MRIQRDTRLAQYVDTLHAGSIKSSAQALRAANQFGHSWKLACLGRGSRVRAGCVILALGNARDGGSVTLQFRFVCATRKSIADFQKESALGKSLGVLQNPVSSLRLFPENQLGLATVYNQAVAEAARDPAILIFSHDDVHLCDFYWPEHLATALDRFQIVGVAGNRRRVPKAPGWAFADEYLMPDEGYRSGTVGHGNGFPPWNVSIYGAAEVEVKQLDGVFIAVHSQTLQETGLRFDERFYFHYYDMDFCRQAERLGLKMGTATVSLIHESTGAYQSDAWRAEYLEYLKKWGD